MSELQTDVDIDEDGAVTGTLEYVTGYTGFSDDPELQEGNYLALKADFPGGVTVTAELKNSGASKITLDEDKNFVVRISDLTTQDELTVAASGEGYADNTVTLDLSGLTLKEEETEEEDADE